jgi:hypothetical protein
LKFLKTYLYFIAIKIMKKQLLTGALAFGTLAVASLLQAAPVKAIGLTCDMSYANKVDAAGSLVNLGCERGTTNNDKLNPLQVNQDSLFGFSDWNFFGKDNLSDNNTKFGEYNLNSRVQNSWSDIMLVLKGGNGNINTKTYVGYLLAQDNLGGWTGDWNSPFSNNNNGNIKDVSHISLYYREGATEVPTPALLPGLIGMGVASLRKKKKQVGEIA